MNFEHWAELLIPAVIVLIWLGKTFWKIRSKFFPQPQTGSGEEEATEWNLEPDEETDHPLTAFDEFLAEAADKGINVGRTPIPAPVPVPTPVPVAAAPPVALAESLPPIGASSGRRPRLRAHPLIAVLRARPQQSIVLAEVLGKPKALQEK